ncbi:MAG: hypothetical protein F6K40_31285 [Okeania sp. SIO3I5]|uniref:hypothetical protein n=1 Tax=Okeania sp. SIO3I5 TaxID=2607805 RepID=UPI0013B92358|nr:hypothetical protein [Okeania sp. SIO3I5]NEQ40474.1 hypothetical protein [Okeania sp. SIO3I5]
MLNLFPFSFFSNLIPILKAIAPNQNWEKLCYDTTTTHSLIVGQQPCNLGGGSPSLC